MVPPATPPDVTPPNRHVAGALLATKDLSIAWSRAIERAVGDFYTDNAVVAALGALRSGPLRPRDLEPITHRHSASVTRLVDRLEDHGDVRRRDAELASDHRAVLVRITRQGRRAIDGVAVALVEHADEIRAPLATALDHLEMLEVTTSRSSEVGSSPVEVCAARDPKGLYAKAESGELPNLTGVGQDYEEPLDPELVVAGDGDLQQAVGAVVSAAVAAPEAEVPGAE